MNILTAIYYWIRKLFFHFFPRKAGAYGRIRPTEHRVGSLRFSLPTPPASWSCWRLRWLMLGNDEYGNCVFCAFAHAIMAVGAWLGTPVTFTRAAVVNAYLVYDDGQDNGVDIDLFCETWQTAGTAGEAPFGEGGPFVKIDPKNVLQQKSAIATFGWIVYGVNLQDAQETQFQEGQRWSYVPGSPVVGGHGIFAGGYDRFNVGPYTVSWGKGFRAEWGFITNCADEAYTGILPPHLKDPAKASELLTYIQGLPSA